MWVPTLGPLFLSLVCGICIGFASDACRICVDFVGFAFLGVSKTYGEIFLDILRDRSLRSLVAQVIY